MRRLARENALALSAAGVATLTMGWLGLYGFGWNDYDTEARPAFDALVQGHVLEFLRLAPVYGGSFVLRVPFALTPGLWGGGELAVYRMLALPCLLAVAALGVWLVANLRARRRPALTKALALGLCVANPLTLGALELGHPEDLLGGVLCVGAVLLALRDRPIWAGLALGIAIANKQWAVLAIWPVLLALPARRPLCAGVAALAAGTVLAPLLLVGSGGFLAATRATASTSSTIFQPWQAWWFIAHHGPVVRGLFGNVKVGYRTAPTWVGRLSHPLILALSMPLGALFWWRRRSLDTQQRGRATLAATAHALPDPRTSAGASAAATGVRPTDALGLLALLLLMRCFLDTWDTSYYTLPFLFALLAWELMGSRQLPLLALSATVLAWVDFQWLPAHASADAQAGFFLLWSTPLLILLTLRLYAPQTAARLLARAHQVWTRDGSGVGALLAPDGPLRRERSTPWAAR
jgi:Glycosyltransferase family 87